MTNNNATTKADIYFSKFGGYSGLRHTLERIEVKQSDLSSPLIGYLQSGQYPSVLITKVNYSDQNLELFLTDGTGSTHRELVWPLREDGKPTYKFIYLLKHLDITFHLDLAMIAKQLTKRQIGVDIREARHGVKLYKEADYYAVVDVGSRQTRFRSSSLTKCEEEIQKQGWTRAKLEVARFLPAVGGKY